MRVLQLILLAVSSIFGLCAMNTTRDPEILHKQFYLDKRQIQRLIEQEEAFLVIENEGRLSDKLAGYTNGEDILMAFAKAFSDVEKSNNCHQQVKRQALMLGESIKEQLLYACLDAHSVHRLQAVEPDLYRNASSR